MENVDVFNNDRRFIFSNWSNEDFIGQWGGVQTIVKSGETKEFVMYLAYHFAKHFIDREMVKEGKGTLVGVDEMRKPYELKTIAEITAGTDSPALATLKKQIEEEVIEAQKGGKKKVKKEEVKEEVKEEKKEFADLK